MGVKVHRHVCDAISHREQLLAVARVGFPILLGEEDSVAAGKLKAGLLALLQCVHARDGGEWVALKSERPVILIAVGVRDQSPGEDERRRR